MAYSRQQERWWVGGWSKGGGKGRQCLKIECSRGRGSPSRLLLVEGIIEFSRQQEKWWVDG